MCSLFCAASPIPALPCAENRELLRMVEQKIKRKENKKKLIMAGLKVGAAIIKMMNNQQ